MPPSATHEAQNVPKIFDSLKQQVGERRYQNWFHEKTRLVLSGDNLHVLAASPYLLNWIQKKFHKELLQASHEILGPGIRLHFEVDAQLAFLPEAKTAEGKQASWPSAPSVSRSTSVPRSSQSTGRPGQSTGASRPRRMDLSEFVIGDCNRLAYTAAQEVARSPAMSYNPLYLYSGVGNGKTHLVEGIARQIKRGFPSLQVVYLTAENFTNYFTSALKQKSTPSFRQRFRHCDVLLVDDVDFLEGKKSTQDEFLHTIQQLESSGRQIVITGDRHPRMMTRLCDELVTRFLSGLVCRIESPVLKTRREIVERIAEQLHLDVTPRALDFVAQRFTNNVRELVGAMNCLNVWSSMHQKRVGITTAREILSNLERDCLKVVRLADVERAVCELFGMTSRDLRSSSRARSIAQPRMLAMYLARRLTHSAYREIGSYFGGRNHATVCAAAKKVEGMLHEHESIRVASEEWPICDVVQTLEQQIRMGA